MIRSENGEVTISGNALDVLADLGVAVLSLKDSLIKLGLSEASARERIMSAVEAGLMSKQEVQRQNEEIARQLEAVFRSILGI